MTLNKNQKNEENTLKKQRNITTTKKQLLAKFTNFEEIIGYWKRQLNGNVKQ